MTTGTQGVNMAMAMELAGRVGDDFASAHAVALGYIGDRLGIFRALAEQGPATSLGLAERTGLNERYVREWAAAMATSGYITYSSEDATFSMTPEQVQVLVTRNPMNLAGGFVYAIACIRQLPKLMEAFREGGGVAFAEFGPEIVEAIERLFAPGYEVFVAHQWIPALGSTRSSSGGEAAEVGSGTGQALIPVARAFHSLASPGMRSTRPG
jgi:hypothetical protein